MDALLLARWQFGITTVYHFLQVPLTIGLAILLAIMQTIRVKTGNDKWERITDFFGKILLINFALGVATGIVQEFQFGLNWSEYSRFVGDIFGAPLAFEALLAFFLESTFLGLWMFGKGRLSPRIHTLCIWLFALGTAISAFFILAANSFMQDPHGGVFNPKTGRAELDGASGFVQVLFSHKSLYAFVHTIAGAFLVAGALVAGFCFWWMARSVRLTGKEDEARQYWRPAAKIGLISMVISSVVLIVSGHSMAQQVVDIQPAKGAAMMGVCETTQSQKFTLAMWTADCDGARIEVPINGLESFMATNHFSGPKSEIKGLEQVNKELQQKYADYYGPDQDYRPNLTVTFYSFRLMMGVGFVGLIAGIYGLWRIRNKRVEKSRGQARIWLWIVFLPFLGNSFGWLLAEMGRQPWVVNPSGPEGIHLLTSLGVSNSVGATSVLLSLVAFTVLYTALGVIWIILLRRYLIEGINPHKKIVEYDANADAPLSFVY